GNKPLGNPRSVTEDKTGAAYEVDLFSEASYVRDLMPGLRAGAYGASFRFAVNDESWNNKPELSGYNPKGIPERTINAASVFEFGPCTFPAYEEASAGLRSMTDEFVGWLDDDKFVARLIERIGGRPVAKLLESIAAADG